MLILDITQYENHINTQAGCSGPHSEEQSPAVQSTRQGWGHGPWSSVDERRPGALAWSPRVSPATGGVGAEHICKQTLPSAPVRSTRKGTASASTRQTEVARRDTRPFRSRDWDGLDGSSVSCVAGTGTSSRHLGQSWAPAGLPGTARHSPAKRAPEHGGRCRAERPAPLPAGRRKREDEVGTEQPLHGVELPDPFQEP